MNTKLINFLFLTILCSLSSNTLASKIEDHPLYNIILSQISIMNKESKENIGFETIMGLLNDLKNRTIKELRTYESNLKNHTMTCEISNNTLNSNLEELQKMLSNYTITINNLKENNRSRETNLNINQELKILTSKKNEYIKSFTSTNKSYSKFIRIANQSKKLINECGYPKLQFLNDFTKEKSSSKVMMDMAVDEYTTCFNKYDSLLSDDLIDYDDTDNSTFKSNIAYYLNNSEYDCIDGNFILGMNSTKELNNTIDRFINYWNAKISFFSNYTLQNTFYDTEISALKKRLEGNAVNNHNNDEIRKELSKLINGTTLAITNILKSITLLNADCKMIISDYTNKIQIR